MFLEFVGSPFIRNNKKVACNNLSLQQVITDAVLCKIHV